MSRTIAVTLALAPTANRESLEAACLAEPGLAVSDLVAADTRVLDRLDDQPHDALVVSCGEESEEVLRFIAGARDQRPGRPVVVLYEGPASGFVTRAFEVGADDLITLADAGPVGHEIAFAVQKAMARRSDARPSPGGTGDGASPRTARGDMITVVSPKGGTGKTLTACNLAAALAAVGKNVAIVDLDLQFGDVGLALGVSPEKTLYELATSGGSLDEEKVGDFLVTHESGVRVLMAPRRPDHAGAIDVHFLRELLQTLRRMADFVVVDTPPGFSPEVIAAIDTSSAICVVAMLDAPSLKNTKLALETLDLMDYDREAIKVVLNRADSRVGISSDDVTTLLGRAPDVLVPSSRDITLSVNEATPVVLTSHNADAKRAFQGLAASFLGAAEGAPDAGTVHTGAAGRKRRLPRLTRKGALDGAS